MVISILLLGCHPDKNKLVQESEIQHRMTDASELYFKNIRKSSYTLEERKEAGMDLYSSEVFSDELLPVEPTIVISWRSDMAFFFMEKEIQEDTVVFKVGLGSDHSITYTGSNQQEGLRLALNIYNALLQGEDISFLDGSEWKPYFSTTEQSKAFRIMFFDFLRLVETR